MKTLDVDSLTNSILMATAKELAKNGISIYETDPNQMWRNMIRTMVVTTVADEHFKRAASDMAEAESLTKQVAVRTKSARAHLSAAAALRKAA